jgi:arylsulfatase A-like enzyme
MTDRENKNFSRREFIGGAIAASAASASIFNSPVSASTRSNIIFILADDMGWGDLSCYGRPDYRTPNLDKLATQGVRFTNAYSAAAICTPTRVGFHTGRYPARLPVGLEEPIPARRILGDRVKITGIPLEHPTVSSLIKSAGYETALIGKWHLGYLPDFGPLKFGFDEFFGIMSGAADHFSHTDPAGEADLYEGDVPVERVGYITDLLTDRAVDYIKRPRKEPFYLSLHYTSPHWPWQGPNDKATAGKFKHGPVGYSAGGSLKIYAEMMKSLDAGVGKVVKELKAAGLEKNTLVIFTSDNGGERFSFNWPFSGQKGDLREGGTRVPGIVRWPGVTEAGTVSHQPVITMDWTATMIAAAGGKPDAKYALDGEDITQVLTARSPVFERTFFWRTRRQGSVRRGKWKYLREGTNEFLFDLSVDEREQADFKAAQPAIVERLRSEFDKWESTVVAYPSS